MADLGRHGGVSQSSAVRDWLRKLNFSLRRRIGPDLCFASISNTAQTFSQPRCRAHLTALAIGRPGKLPICYSPSIWKALRAFPARRGDGMRSLYCRTLAIGFAFLMGMTGRAAVAQESPELPSKARTEGEPTTENQTRFYKGKGPGRGNSYVERYEEDYTYLRDPARSSDFFDPLKFIPLGADGEVYLTLNGEARFRYDNTDHRNFAIATAATPARTAGGLPTLTPATEVSTNQLYKQRYALGADLHLGPNLRFYTDLYHGQQTGHRVGPTIPGNQRDALGLVNGFGEVYGILDDAKTGLRAGRQEIFFGNNLQVRANVSTNLPSPVFDGFRAYRDWGPARIDAFAYNLVQFVDGVLQDR